jgi:hypothetical protein
MKWSQQEDIDAFVQNVIDHIGAAVYTNPVTGCSACGLIRNDYNIRFVRLRLRARFAGSNFGAARHRLTPSPTR